MSGSARVIYIISDLHLGGAAELPSRDQRERSPGKRSERGFRICTHESELAEFVHSLAELPRPGVELVINGDMVDFLAERSEANPPGWSAFHYPEQNAVHTLDVIAGRTQIVFDAIKAFVRRGHRLVILPGNHDIELHLPAVRRRLRHHVGADGPADYEFIGHGEAYRVGDVLIEHGNRVDEMNFVDHQALRHLCGLVSRGMAVHKEFLFEPPAGSKLVADVINDLKGTYSFIDLLKPEAEAAFPVILALEPSRRWQLLEIASLLREGRKRRREQLKLWRSTISARTDLPADPEAAEPLLDPLEEIMLRTVGRRDFGAARTDSGAVQNISLLGKARSFVSLLLADRDETWESRLSNLIDALRAFQHTNSFDTSVETEQAYFVEARDLAYGPVRHVIFGHTHLAKKVPLPNGGFYFNSGTWADLLELPPAILDPTRTFTPLGDLEQFMLELIDNDFSRHVLFRPTYVRIEQDDEGRSVAHELCAYSNEKLI